MPYHLIYKQVSTKRWQPPNKTSLQLYISIFPRTSILNSLAPSHDTQRPVAHHEICGTMCTHNVLLTQIAKMTSNKRNVPCDNDDFHTSINKMGQTDINHSD